MITHLRSFKLTNRTAVAHRGLPTFLILYKFKLTTIQGWPLVNYLKDMESAREKHGPWRGQHGPVMIGSRRFARNS